MGELLWIAVYRPIDQSGFPSEQKQVKDVLAEEQGEFRLEMHTIENNIWLLIDLVPSSDSFNK